MAKLRSVPKNAHTATPQRICADMADAIEFHKKALAAEGPIRLQGPEGRLIHACTGNAAVDGRSPRVRDMGSQELREAARNRPNAVDRRS